MKNRFPILIASAALLAAVGSEGLPAQETRFRPEDCFPGDSLVYLSLGSIERFQAGLGGTIFGRMASHPGVRAALGALPDIALAKFRELTAELQAATGMDFLEALSLPRGEVAASFECHQADGVPGVAVAVELGPKRDALLELLRKVDRLALEAAGGGELPTQMMGN